MAHGGFPNDQQRDTHTLNTQPIPWQPMPLEEILDSSLRSSRDTPPPGGIIYQGFVFRNPKVIANLRRLENTLYQLGTDNFRVSGGDRYVDSQGNHRSATNNQIISESAFTSPYLIENGARAADVVETGISIGLFKQAVATTDFWPPNTIVYRNHFHVALANLPANKAS